VRHSFEEKPLPLLATFTINREKSIPVLFLVLFLMIVAHYLINQFDSYLFDFMVMNVV